ncbi:MAG: hypothetical protein IKE43_00105 [Coriobacteriales bacterium]|nr:hypothetical protein [Coriobacteriales bacterium]
MLRFRNALVFISIALVLCVPFTSTVLSKLGVVFPKWTGISEPVSYLDGGFKHGFPQVSAQTITSGEFQDNLELFLADHVPLRDNAVLAKSMTEHAIIGSMAFASSYDWYPTYFGSDTFYSDQYDALAPLPADFDPQINAGLSAFAENLTAYAQAHQDVNFYIYMVDQFAYSEANPLRDLEDDLPSTREFITLLQDGTAGLTNVHVTGIAYTDVGEYLQNYWRSDHHWNNKGALAAYNALALLASKPLIEDVEFTNLEGIIFNGSTARYGRYPVDEIPFDSTFDVSNLEMDIYGELPPSEQAMAAEKSPDEEKSTITTPQEIREAYLNSDHDRFDAFYENYYGDVIDTLITNKAAGTEQGEALLVGDSYASAIQYYIAGQYETTYVTYELYWESTDTPGEEPHTLDLHNARDVYFVANPADYASLLDRFPELFR